MAGKKKKKKKFIKVLLGFLVTLLGIAALVVIVFAVTLSSYRKEALHLTKDVTQDTFKQTQTSIVYDIEGNEITSLSGIKELYYISDTEIPDLLKKAFVLIEDRDFYSHSGIDKSAIIRAMIANARSEHIEQGASTITQQLAKNMFLTPEVTWKRKITEMFVAFELEKKFSKTQILEFYINNIYFANGYYGIQAAAQGYFGKDVNELSVSQLAFLAGIPNNPSKYDPAVKYDNVIERRDNILKQLFAAGYISSVDYYKAIEEKIVLKNSEKSRKDDVVTYVFYCATRALMEDNGFTFRTTFDSEEDEKKYNEKYDEWYSKYQKMLFTNGYRIYTSIDMAKQELLQQIANEELKDFTDTNDEGIYALQCSAVCIDNSTGFVTAIVGGRRQEYDGYTLNRAYQSYRQPGSAIKPLNVYAPYMMLGHDPQEIVDDSRQADGPENVDGIYRGEITLAEALGWSSNVCAWNIMNTITPSYGMSFLHLMDFKKTAADDNNLSSSLGGFTYGVSAVEMAAGYATLENDGVYRIPTCVSKITDSNDSILVDNLEEGKIVYDETSARKVTKMMEYGVNHGLLTHSKIENAIVAAKSGTTNDNKDGWIAGYSRYFTTVVWVGNDIPSTVEGLYGGTYPDNIWKKFMNIIHEGLELKPFPGYDGSLEDSEDSLYHQMEDEKETPEERPTLGDNSLDIDDGDRYTPVTGDGDKDVDVSGMGDKDAR